MLIQGTLREGRNNANIEPVTYNETIQILDGRTKKSGDISGNDLEALKTEEDGKMITNKAEATKKTYQQTVVTTKAHFIALCELTRKRRRQSGSS